MKYFDKTPCRCKSRRDLLPKQRLTRFALSSFGAIIKNTGVISNEKTDFYRPSAIFLNNTSFRFTIRTAISNSKKKKNTLRKTRKNKIDRCVVYDARLNRITKSLRFIIFYAYLYDTAAADITRVGEAFIKLFILNRNIALIRSITRLAKR